MPRILVVESGQTVTGAMQRCLRDQGYAATIANTGPAALRDIERFQPDLIVLEVISPAYEGIDFYRRIRAKAPISTPIIALTSPGEDIELAELTIDDHVVKPIRPRELTARINALLYPCRRQVPIARKIIDLHDLRIDPRTRSVETPRATVRLTAKEFDLLYFLAANPGRVFSREQLLSHVWDRAFPGGIRTVTSHVWRIRTKIELDASMPRHLKTVWSIGYMCKP